MEEAYDRHWRTNSNSCFTVYKINLKVFGCFFLFVCFLKKDILIPRIMTIALFKTAKANKKVTEIW